MRTRQIHVGHAIVLAPPGYNPPARVTERIATLDLISSGRVEWGIGLSASRTEIEGFNIDTNLRREMWAEATEQTANMLAMEPYPGFTGKFFAMPTRNVIPKPHQKPHPPIWIACSNREIIHAAARAGIGALAFAFIDPTEAGKWAREYYTIPRSRDNPEVCWVNDTEIVGDLVAISAPVLWQVVAQEGQHRDAEICERGVALVVGDLSVHQPP